MADAEANAGDLAECFEILANFPIHRSGCVGQPAAAQAACQVAGIDADRAGRGAHATTGAGVEAHVGIGFAHLAGVFANRCTASQFPHTGDTLAGRERQAVRWAERFAETAFDAAVDDVLGGRHRLEVFQVGVRVVVDDHTRVEQAFRVEQGLDAAHQVGGFLAPFHFDEGRHVAAGAVLGLERAVVLVDDQLAQVVHEAGVAVDLGFVAEILRDDEVQVALQRVAENDAFVVAVVAQQALQVERGIGQRLDGEGDVLDQHRGAGATHGADGREGALAHLPVHLAGGRVGRELHRLDGGNAIHRSEHGGDFFLQPFRVRRAHFDQQRGGLFAQFAHHGRQAGLVLDRMDGRAVEQFDGRYRLRLEADDGLAGAADVREKNEGRSLVRIFRHRLVGDAAHEAERALRADHQVGQDVDRVFEIDQCIEAVAGGVLDLELVADAAGQRGVGARLAAQPVEFAEQRGVRSLEGSDAQRVFGIEQAAVGKHDAQAGQRLVAVLRRAAAHAGGVVGGDAADLGCADRGRVGADLPAERGEATIDLATDHAGADAHLAGVVGQLEGGEALADQRQHAVGNGLA